MENLVEQLEEAFSEMAQGQDQDYYNQPIPSELDGKVGRVVRMFLDSSPTERGIFFRLTNEGVSYLFIIFAERMASLGVRERSRQRLLEGLLALVIEDYRADYRDSLIVLAALSDAATKISVTPEELFAEAASYSNNSVVSNITEFHKWDPADWSLKAVGYKEVNGPDGFRYVWG